MKDQRRYPRVQVSKTLAGLAPVLSASIAWPNHEISEVVDLSYKGLAARRPGLYPVNAQESTVIEVTLGNWPTFTTSAKIAWCNLEWVGLQFESLSADGHYALAQYLDAKLVGSMMKPVERLLVSGAEDFQYWYQGPDQTHVYVWMSADAVERVRVDREGQAVEFTRGQPRLKLNSAERRALLVLSQMDKSGLPMEEFVRNLLVGA